MRIEPLGDRALLITLGAEIAPAVYDRVQRSLGQLRAARLAGVTDMVPAFASIVLHYDPTRIAASADGSPYATLAAAVEQCLRLAVNAREPTGSLVEIPVCYGGAFGPDLEDLAAAHKLAPDAVVRLHAGHEYFVYMLGFLPGFAYLGGLPPELATPRRSTPRSHVPAGSVGIGGEQTGVYPLESPGGWHIIGRTPERMFRPEQDPPVRLAMGDRVRFRAISENDFGRLESSAQ